MAELVKVPAMCQACGRVPKHSPHSNARYCLGCKTDRLAHPRATVTAAQAAQIRALVDTLPRREIATQVGIRQGTLQRWLRQEGLRSNARDYPAAVVEAVCHVYEQAPPHQGKRRVQETFPDVNVRSIVERRKPSRPRQIRWTDDQMREAAKMAGLVSHTAQAHYFGRPNAYEGSLHSLWTKRFRCAPSDLNGFGMHRAGLLARPGCPAVLVKRMETGTPIAKVLWLDLANQLRPDVPDWIRAAVRALAQFQRWLHAAATSTTIRQMIADREEE